MTNTSYEAVRDDILDTVKQLKSGKMDPSMGLAVAANYKVFNDNVFAQVAQGKLALLVGNKARTVEAGQQQLGAPRG